VIAGRHGRGYYTASRDPNAIRIAVAVATAAGYHSDMSTWFSVAVAASLAVWSGCVDARGDVDASGEPLSVSSDCTFGGKKLYGDIKVVTSFPDFEVKVVDSFADLHVKTVESFADSCGRWRMVDSFPDFTIRYVDSFPDFTIKRVDSFPGLP
jgi:hypothetical protein